MTATTGIAALQISGITIHSFAGIGLGKEAINVLYDRIKRSKEKERVWLNTKVLIIDEVSMSPADLFTKLNILGKLIRKSNKPFGVYDCVMHEEAVLTRFCLQAACSSSSRATSSSCRQFPNRYPTCGACDAVRWDLLVA